MDTGIAVDAHVVVATAIAPFPCRGYALTASGSESALVVSIHNATNLMSSGPVTFLLRSPLVLKDGASDGFKHAHQPLIVASACSPRHPVDVYVAIVDGTRRTVAVYQSILPFTLSSYDVMWMRTPMYGSHTYHCRRIRPSLRSSGLHSFNRGERYGLVCAVC